jgi:hypothetical protein
VRFSLFIAITLYAWGAMFVLEWLRESRAGGAAGPVPGAGVH